MSGSAGLTAPEQVAVLGRAAQLLASSTEFDATLAHTIAACLPALGDFGFFDVVVDGTPEGGTVRRTARAFEDPALEALLAPTQWVRNERKDFNLCALSSGEPGLHAGIDDAWYRAVAVNEGHLGLLRTLGFCSMLTVPMRYRDELVGALTLFFSRSQRHHTAEHLAFAEKLAALAVPVVVNARLVDRNSRAEQALRLSEERLRLAADAGRLGLWEWNIVDNRIVWSDRVYDLHGLPRGRFAGTVEAFGELVHPDDRARVEASIEVALAGGAAYEVEFRTPLPDGTTRWLATRAEIVRDASGKPLRMLGATVDVTERVELLAAERGARAEAERARSEAESASRAKDEFLAILGHELRNPLAPIVTALELIKERGHTELRRERGIIERQVNHLSRLVDDLLDVSRIVRGRVDLELRTLDIATIVDKAVEMTRPLYVERDIELETRVPSAWVQGDTVRLAQVIGNLLTNAAKFTPPRGRVVIEATERDGQIEIAVTDTGQGIAPELLTRIFGLFVQGPQSLERRQGGLGLGLAIVSNLVSLHGGTIEADSAGPGQGATFRVRLPRVDAPAPKPTAAQPSRIGAGTVSRVLTGSRVLVVDDNVDAAELLGELLRRSGYVVSVETSAPSALATAAATRHDLAILDIGLPEIDGYALAQRLRALDPSNKLRLIAMTGYGMEADRDRAREGGFDEHITKPVHGRQLLQAIAQLLAR